MLTLESCAFQPYSPQSSVALRGLCRVCEELLGPRSLGLVVGDAEVTVDAGESFCHAFRVPLLRPRGLQVTAHRLDGVAIAAFERVGRFHASPDPMGQCCPLGFEFLWSIDGARELAVEL